MGGGGHGEKVPGVYMGWWGNLGSPTQKGIVTYSLSSNRQKPLGGAGHAAIFNTWRRFRQQALYFIPPLVGGYMIMEWAIERNEYLNSKPGRLEFAGQE